MTDHAPVAAAPRLLHDNPDWYTPVIVVELAREVLGTIDLDPATDLSANEDIRATRIYTRADDGLTKEWTGRVFLNPPGGEVPLWWMKLARHYYKGSVTAAVWVGYSLEQLQTLQKDVLIYTPLTVEGFCVPRRRLHFRENLAMQAARLARNETKAMERMEKGLPRLHRRAAAKGTADAPTHGNYISYLGPKGDLFRKVFKTLGQCR